jgi:hypothetical protein
MTTTVVVVVPMLISGEIRRARVLFLVVARNALAYKMRIPSA